MVSCFDLDSMAEGKLDREKHSQRVFLWLIVVKDNPDPSCNISCSVTRRCPLPVWLRGLVLQLDVSIKVSVRKVFEGQQQQKDSVIMICVPYVFSVSELVYKALFPS